jgi:hypothetical protein
VAAGLYIVPLYTLLQQRAPKSSKGNIIAASNFLNVVGGIFAVFMFYTATFALEGVFGPILGPHDVVADPTLLPEYIAELQRQVGVPRSLFTAVGVFTVTVLVLLFFRLPDFFVRALVWLRSGCRNPFRVEGLDNLPPLGAAILVTNCKTLEECVQVVAATDRFTQVILVEQAATAPRRSLLRWVARHTGMIALGGKNLGAEEWQHAFDKGLETLRRGETVAIGQEELSPDAPRSLLDQWLAALPAQVIPVCCIDGARADRNDIADPPRIVFGLPLEPTPAASDARLALETLGCVSVPAQG